MTPEQQEKLITAACHEAGLTAHVRWIANKRQAETWAERIAMRFKGTSPMVFKNSYMYCDTLDMCFFYTPQGVPQVAYAGYATADSADITKGKLVEAFRKADTVLRRMKGLAEGERHGGQ